MIEAQAGVVVRMLARGGRVGLVYGDRGDLRAAMEIVRPMLAAGLAGPFSIGGRCRVTTESGGKLIPVQFGKQVRGVRLELIWLVGDLDLSVSRKVAWIACQACSGAEILPFNAMGSERRISKAPNA